MDTTALAIMLGALGFGAFWLLSLRFGYDSREDLFAPRVGRYVGYSSRAEALADQQALAAELQAARERRLRQLLGLDMQPAAPDPETSRRGRHAPIRREHRRGVERWTP